MFSSLLSDSGVGFSVASLYLFLWLQGTSGGILKFSLIPRRLNRRLVQMILVYLFIVKNKILVYLFKVKNKIPENDPGLSIYS